MTTIQKMQAALVIFIVAAIIFYGFFYEIPMPKNAIFPAWGTLAAISLFYGSVTAMSNRTAEKREHAANNYTATADLTKQRIGVAFSLLLWLAMFLFSARTIWLERIYEASWFLFFPAFFFVGAGLRLLDEPSPPASSTYRYAGIVSLIVGAGIAIVGYLNMGTIAA